MTSRINRLPTMMAFAAVGLLGASMIRPVRTDCDDEPNPVETAKRQAEEMARLREQRRLEREKRLAEKVLLVAKPPQNGSRERARRLRKMAKEPSP